MNNRRPQPSPQLRAMTAEQIQRFRSNLGLSVDAAASDEDSIAAAEQRRQQRLRRERNLRARAEASRALKAARSRGK